MNNFEQVSSDGYKMSVAGTGPWQGRKSHV